MQTFKIKDSYITLVQFLKINSLINSGGETKIFIESNNITLNGIKVFEKRKKIYPGDILIINDTKIKVESGN